VGTGVEVTKREGCGRRVARVCQVERAERRWRTECPDAVSIAAQVKTLL
jgi:hypothetical protein